MDVLRFRNGLHHTRAALERGTLTVGYIGGSITDGRAAHNWPYPVTAWLVNQFPTARIVEENAGIGATGSDLAVFRAERDLINRGCDLVFVEYAVNDGGATTERRGRTREGLLRKLLAGEGRDVVIVYTYNQEMYTAMAAGQMPDTIREFEELADHYGIPSVWMSLNAFNEVKAGLMRWEEWLPDGLHPQSRGSLSYAQSVMALLDRELRTAPSPGRIPTGDQLPAPLDPQHWGGCSLLPLTIPETTGPWALRRWPKVEWIDQVLETAALGATLAFTFTGRGVALGFDYGNSSAEFRYRLDGGEWLTSQRERPEWCGDEGWFCPFITGDDLPVGEHRIELEVIHGNAERCTGTNFRLAMIGVIP